jgi:hypothetical protein
LVTPFYPGRRGQGDEVKNQRTGQGEESKKLIKAYNIRYVILY